MKRQKIKIKDGKIKIGTDKLRSTFRSLSDGEYAVEISKWKNDRSLRQNRYYWKIITIIGSDLGYRKNEMHEVFLNNFSPIKTVRNLDGKPIQTPVRTSEMDVEQMKEYLDTIIQFAAEQNINLPNPEYYGK
jgi:hypothetical protein